MPSIAGNIFAAGSIAGECAPGRAYITEIGLDLFTLTVDEWTTLSTDEWMTLHVDENLVPQIALISVAHCLHVAGSMAGQVVTETAADIYQAGSIAGAAV